MLRKLLFVANLVFINYINVQIYIPLVILLFSYFLHQVCRPYKAGQLNRLEKISLVSLILVSLCGLYLQIAEEYVNLKIGLIITAYCANFFFLGYFFKIFIEIKAEELKHNKKFMAVILFIDKYFSCCMKIPFMKKLHNNLKIFEPIQNDSPMDSNRDSDSSIPKIEINSSPINRKSKFAKYEACSPFIVNFYEVNSSESPELPENNIPDPTSDPLSNRELILQSLEEKELDEMVNEIVNDDCEEKKENENLENIEKIEIEEEYKEEDFGSHDEKLISLPNLETYSPRPHGSFEKIREDRRDTF